MVTICRTQYGLYQEAVSLLKLKHEEKKWEKAVYWVFDAPGIPEKPFEVTIVI